MSQLAFTQQSFTQLDEAKEILKARAERIKERDRRAAACIWENGKEFYEAQQELAQRGYGCFVEWAESETGHKRQTIYNYIYVYRNLEFPKFGKANIAISALYLVAAPSTPDEARLEIAERLETGEFIDPGQAKEIIDQHKAIINRCPTCHNLYDPANFPIGCPYCYKSANNLNGWVEDLPQRMERESNFDSSLALAGESKTTCQECGLVYEGPRCPDCDPDYNYLRDNRRMVAGDIYTPQRMDACQTPAYALDPLLPYLPKNWIIWEPAAGEGNIVEALFDSGFKSVVSTDLIRQENFFEFEPDTWDCIVTNPPFSIHFEWLERCYKLGQPFALLLKVDILGTKTAQELFDRHGIEVIFVSPRINFKMPNKGWDSQAQFATAWFTYGLNIGRQMTFVRLKANGSSD